MTELSGKRLLWIENEMTYLVKERQALEKSGVVISYAGTPGAAYAALSKNEFDIAIVDWLIPGELPLPLANLRRDIGIPREIANGPSIALWIRRNKPGLRYFYYTALDNAFARYPEALSLIDPKGDLVVSKLDPSAKREKFVDTVIHYLGRPE
jgi:hypothetical protein